MLHLFLGGSSCRVFFYIFCCRKRKFSIRRSSLEKKHTLLKWCCFTYCWFLPDIFLFGNVVGVFVCTMWGWQGSWLYPCLAFVRPHIRGARLEYKFSHTYRSKHAKGSKGFQCFTIQLVVGSNFSLCIQTSLICCSFSSRARHFLRTFSLANLVLS